MTESSEKKEDDLISEYEWLIRPCEMYKEEYRECTSIRGRLHQYFIYGETLDCSQWNRDLNNCTKWTDTKDIKAAELLIQSERKRRQERLKAHYANNVWEKRTSPPEDWNKPLPDYIAKDYENSYLGNKAKELRGENVPTNILADRTLCVIL